MHYKVRTPASIHVRAAVGSDTKVRIIGTVTIDKHDTAVSNSNQSVAYAAMFQLAQKTPS